MERAFALRLLDIAEVPLSWRGNSQARVCALLNRTMVDAPESKAKVSSFGPTSGTFALSKRRFEVGFPAARP
jgi:hypothetical protein